MIEALFIKTLLKNHQGTEKLISNTEKKKVSITKKLKNGSRLV